MKCRECQCTIRSDIETLKQRWGLCNRCFKVYKKIGKGLPKINS